MAEATGKKNFFEKPLRFFREVRAEIKKVVWPSPEELKKHTSVVVTAIIIIGVIVAVLDFVFAKTVGFVVDVTNPPAQTEQTPVAPESEVPISVGEDQTGAGENVTDEAPPVETEQGQ